MKPEWYQKARRRGGTPGANRIPLDNETCSRTSIYYVGLDGSLWTLSGYDGDPYKQVRDDVGHKDFPGYVCVHCGAFEPDFNDVEAAHVFGSSVGIKLEIS